MVKKFLDIAWWQKLLHQRMARKQRLGLVGVGKKPFAKLSIFNIAPQFLKVSRILLVQVPALSGSSATANKPQNC